MVHAKKNPHSSQVVATMDVKMILIGNIVTQVSNVAHLYYRAKLTFN